MNYESDVAPNWRLVRAAVYAFCALVAFAGFVLAVAEPGAALKPLVPLLISLIFTLAFLVEIVVE